MLAPPLAAAVTATTLMATLNQLQSVAMVTAALAAQCQQHLAAETPPVVNLLPCTHIITLPLLSSVIQCRLKGRRQRKTKLSSCPYCIGNWVCALCSSASPIDVAAIAALQPGDWRGPVTHCGQHLSLEMLAIMNLLHLKAGTTPVANLLPCTHINTLRPASSVIQCCPKGQKKPAAEA